MLQDFLSSHRETLIPRCRRLPRFWPAMSVIGTLFVIVGAPLMGALFSASGSFTLPFMVLAALPAGALWATTGLPRGSGRAPYFRSS